MNTNVIGKEKISINEIFMSIDGEVNQQGQGTLTTFIRTQGCNLRCSYCDTEKALLIDNSKEFSIADILEKIETDKVTLTGGEPLLEENIFLLIDKLVERVKYLSIETNGSIYIPHHYRKLDKINWIVDYKLECPDLMIAENFCDLKRTDWIKFVISNEKDFEDALKVCREWYLLCDRSRVAFSSGGKLSHKWLVENLIKQKKWNIAVNVQIHKLINIQ